MKKAIVLLSMCLLCFPVVAQIQSNTADNKVTQPGETNPLFIFYSSSESPKKGSLKAYSSRGGLADFYWDVFQSSDTTFVNFDVQTGVGSSEVNNLEYGGYRVRVVNETGVADTFYNAWVFIDSLKIDSLSYVNDCGGLLLKVNAKKVDYYYYDLTNFPRILEKYIANKLTLKWTPSVDIHQGVKYPNTAWMNTTWLTTSVDAPPPMKDATYKVEMTDIFGNKQIATTPLIPAIAVCPQFDVLVKQLDGTFTVSDNPEGEALFTVKFDNKSLNADSYSWVGYGNRLNKIERTKELWTATTVHVGEQDYIPGEFPVKLTASNSSTGCSAYTYITDGAKDSIYLIVYPSKLDPNAIPNVFSPNGDGLNDIFTFVSGEKPVSIRQMTIQIFNSNGIQVYKYSGPASNWEGWNGQKDGSKGDCAPGQYYYLINAQGWDNVGYGGSQYRGTLYLFREN